MSRTCFVLAPLDKRRSATRRKTDRLCDDIITPALAPLGFDIVHAADVAMSGDIMAHIIMLVATGELIVADVTGGNPNVMYELGIRAGMGKAAILVSRDLDALPFDIEGLRTILIDDTTSAGVVEAIHDVRRYAQNSLAHLALAAGPVAAQYAVTVTPRNPDLADATALVHREQPRTQRPIRRNEWRLELSDAFEEQVLALVDSDLMSDLVMRLLTCIQGDPHAGMPMVVGHDKCYAVRTRSADKLPSLLLVYAVADAERIVSPLIIVRDDDNDLLRGDGSEGPFGGTSFAAPLFATAIAAHVASHQPNWH